jgi:hypothetical protein
MTPDALELLSMVAAFLEDTVAGQVPPALRSDVRAAAKNLADARDELDAAFPLLARECGELAGLVAKAREALDMQPPLQADSAPATSLSALKLSHDRLAQDLGDTILMLQASDNETARAALTDIFTVLREQAGRRLGWQSVFPPDRLVSDVLRGTWKGKT